jgi:CheY-like chemotaxis protein
VDDLVNVSRINRGLIQIKPAIVDLREILRDGIELARPLIDERGHRLVAEEPDRPQHVNGDPERLAQVVSNLLTNAAKYTSPGGLIQLGLQTEQGQVVLRVRDNGLGISQDRLNDVFQMFSQLPEHREHVGGGGLGVGLALSRMLIELHGGTVEVKSAGPGHGSEFLVTLPLAIASDEQPTERTADAGRNQRRVLVVDDNVDAADGLGMLLRISGHEVRTAYDGAEALDVIQSFPADVILLDIGLPKIDGYEVARRVREIPGRENVVLIALTGWGQAEARHRTDEAGFDIHLTKPIDPTLLMKLLES